MIDKVKPTQADREAAAALLASKNAAHGTGWEDSDLEPILSGDRDDWDNVQIFARHAAQARAEGMLIGARLGLEASVNVVQHLEVPEKGLGTTRCDAWCLSINMGLEAIRNLSASDVVQGNE